MKHVVKRGKHTESFDEKKLYASVYAACLSVREHPGSAEVIADSVVKDFEKWLANKHEVTSNDIRKIAHDFLQTINSDAAYMYLHHRVIW
jgi:transcriptional regulator NrdR family protein